MPFDLLPTEPLTEAEQEARDDLFRWLDRFPGRVPALLDAVREGRMNGGTYRGECRCVIGTLAHTEIIEVGAAGVFSQCGLPWADTPIEPFVELLRPGDTPSNSPVMAHLERWIVQWQAR